MPGVGEVREMVEGAKIKAVDTLDNLEQLFEERVAKALARAMREVQQLRLARGA